MLKDNFGDLKGSTRERCLKMQELLNNLYEERKLIPLNNNEMIEYNQNGADDLDDCNEESKV